MRRMLGWLVLVLVACGSDAPPAAPDDGGLEGATEAAADASTIEPPLTTQGFSESADDVPNPERGFVDQVDFTDSGDFSFVRKNGRTLAYAGIHLEAYRFKDLDAAILQMQGSGFARARAAGIKLVLRFVYNDGPGTVSGAADASLAQIVAHLASLAPTLQANADVIAVMNAGFIGFWGEWHHSGGVDTNNLDNDPAHEAVLHALLTALPPSRMIEIRTPMAKGAIYGAALTDVEAYSGAEKARIGHHNDCFLSSPDDYGTYATQAWKDFVATDTRFTPHGGETCSLDPPRSDCSTSTAEMAKLHTSHLNALYSPQVLGGWQTQGCMPDVKRRLGYRLSLTTASWSERVRPGGVLRLGFTMHNSGYAALFNERTVYAVIDTGSAVLTAPLSSDPRRWVPGVDATYDGKLRLPADLAPGTYRLALWLPDPATALQPRPEYAIQLVNPGVWDAQKGYDVLTTALTVDAAAPGSVDPTAKTFAELP